MAVSKSLRTIMIHFLGPGTLWPNEIRVLIIKVKEGGETVGKLPDGVTLRYFECVYTSS